MGFHTSHPATPDALDDGRRVACSARPRGRRTACLLAILGAAGSIVLGAAVLAPAASASQIVSTSSVSDLTLGVNNEGEAMVSYTANGKAVHVLAWGAANAIDPVAGGAQTALRLEYDGGFAKNYTDDPVVHAAVLNLRLLQTQMTRDTASKDNLERYALAPQIAAAYGTLASLRSAADDYWQSFSCPTYDGPALAWEVAACQAPDGSYWAIQEWQRKLPDYGVAPTAIQAAMEVHISHWTGALPVLTISEDWAYKKYNHLFGSFTYNGTGVYGFSSTPGGVPLDTFGRNLYVDTYDSAYGPGWMRENSFLTHDAGGTFCYGFYPHGAHPAGNGTMYRATIMGPGLTPDVMWQGDAPAAYNVATEAAADQAILALDDPHCIPV